MFIRIVELGVLEKMRWKDIKRCLENWVFKIKVIKMFFFGNDVI